jgi:hypothetical protein
MRNRAAAKTPPKNCAQRSKRHASNSFKKTAADLGCASISETRNAEKSRVNQAQVSAERQKGDHFTSHLWPSDGGDTYLIHCAPAETGPILRPKRGRAATWIPRALTRWLPVATFLS